jgi:hypothetical protein
MVESRLLLYLQVFFLFLLLLFENFTRNKNTNNKNNKRNHSMKNPIRAYALESLGESTPRPTEPEPFAVLFAQVMVLRYCDN